jgi:hypothetical protein
MPTDILSMLDLQKHSMCIQDILFFKLITRKKRLRTSINSKANHMKNRPVEIENPLIQQVII